MKPKDQLDLAQKQLEKVQLAAWEPQDWDDLFLYGFYCLENAICAAANHVGIEVKANHRSKAEVAEILKDKYNFPNISELIVKLNDARKAVAYGDIEHPDLDAEDVARDVEEYVYTVERFLES